jgi:3-oxoacyl-[acyl-carrier-protein] synthase II
MAERVVLTGAGALTPIGNTAEKSWQASLAGVCGIEEISPYGDRSDVHYAALIKDFNPANFIDDSKLIRRRSYPTWVAVASSRMAIEDSRLPRATSTAQALRRGVMAGSGFANSLEIIGDYEFFKEKGRAKADTATRVEPEQMASTINKLEYFMGKSMVMSTACGSGLTALRAAYEAIKDGYADVMLAVGADALLYPRKDGSLYHPISIACYEGAGALATGKVESPAVISKPFSADRKGFVIANVAAAVVLESYTHAKARGAQIYAELYGAAGVNGAGDDTNPSVEGQIATLELATQMAGLQSTQLVHGNMHGTGTYIGDPAEIASVILFRKGKLDEFKLSASKSKTGHGIGGTGMWEAIETALAVRDDVIPPTPNHGPMLEIPSYTIQAIPPKIFAQYGSIPPDYDKYPLFSKHSVKTNVPYAFSNSFGFGDFNESAIFGKVK